MYAKQEKKVGGKIKMGEKEYIKLALKMRRKCLWDKVESCGAKRSARMSVWSWAPPVAQDWASC